MHSRSAGNKSAHNRSARNGSARNGSAHNRLVQHQFWLDRAAAGAALSQRISMLPKLDESTALVALPRGGVAVGAVIAKMLGLPLTTWSVRKLALPSNPEYAIGAIASGDVVLWDSEISRYLEQYPQLCSQVLEAESCELLRRKHLFGDVAPEALRDRILIVVDDGIATGLTAKVALLSLQRLSPKKLILAVPVVASMAMNGLRPLVDDVIALAVVEHLTAVGCHYQRFEQLTDDDVLALMAGTSRPR
jgi:putative phosphoribosyl transferase